MLSVVTNQLTPYKMERLKCVLGMQSLNDQEFDSWFWATVNEMGEERAHDYLKYMLEKMHD